ncbi:Hypothetical_protein [Hexamita inflata]|uniref:Hypothetical_protein n=1 Tax=Hexamita inflata TaxID=28002 RepID=A0AA86TUU7_9EUKA|nr:Hypothetical protein HINF_LOCUS17161 [Hexamita inflata]
MISLKQTLLNEYISTHSSAGSLRIGTHLSFHRTSTSRRFWVSFVSTYTHSWPLARFAQLYFEPLALRVNCLIFESHNGDGWNWASTALVCPKHAALSLSVLTSISVAAGSFCWRRSSSFVRSGMRETLAIYDQYMFIQAVPKHAVFRGSYFGRTAVFIRFFLGFPSFGQKVAHTRI